MLWTKKRAKKLIRAKNGKFKKWIGGAKKSEMKKQENNFQGIAIHIGKEFKRQFGRVAKVGDIVRKKKANGTYHLGAMWYIRTPNGWRKSHTEFIKPSKSQIKARIAGSRKGQK